MNLRFVSLVVLALGLGGLLVFQATRGTAALVKLPGELVELGNQTTLSRIRVAGKVTADSIDYSLEPTMVLKFRIRNPGKVDGDEATAATLPVVYNGIKPDMFAAGRDVIVDGEFSGGVFTATKLLTQCPSKYEPPTPGGVAGSHKQ